MPPERTPISRPDLVRTVPAGTGIRIGDSVVLALPYSGDVRYLVWSSLDVHLVKPEEFRHNAPVVGD